MDENQFIGCREVITNLVRQNTTPNIYQWLEERARLVHEETGSSTLRLAFAAVPRKTGRKTIEIAADDLLRIESDCGGVILEGWPTDRLCRLWLIMQVNTSDKNVYCNKLEDLFRNAEMNELVALYASLPFFAYPEAWQMLTAEGIRSNIAFVLEAIMYHNPYPQAYLSEPAWNQLVLKAFFTEKAVNRIIGLDKRANSQLASILVDYAHERWAAGRSVDPLLWRLVSRFIDAGNLKDIKRLFEQGDEREKKAAALACSESEFPPAKRLLEEESPFNKSVLENKLHWDSI